MKKALITGITGQDGSYLAELLLEKEYQVHGIVRRASVSNTARIDHIKDRITLHDGDLSDSSGLIRIIGRIRPDEIYNLAAQSHVQVSFDVPEYSGDVDALVQAVKGEGGETVVNQETYQQLRKERSIIHLKQMGKEVQVRFVGENYIGADCQQVEPTLEDYYIFTSGINID